MPELDAAARNYLANPYAHPVTPSTGPSASGEPSRWNMQLPVSNETRTTQSTISLVNGKLQLLKPRKYDLKEWTAYMMSTARRLFAYECGISHTITTDLAPFLAVTNSRELEDYIAWVLGMIDQYTWPTMLEFDTFIRDQMTTTQTGSFHLVVILAAFLSRCASKGKLPKPPHTTHKDAPKRKAPPCRAYNKESGCTRSDCKFSHVCSSCGSSAHGRHNHPNNT